MQIIKHKPSARLSELVRYYWFYDHESTSHQFEKILPFGAVDLILHRKEPMQLGDQYKFKSEPYAFIEGQYLNYSVKKPSHSTSFVGISLYPWATSVLFHTPALDFTENLVDLDDINASLSNHLREIANNSSNRNEIVDKLDDTFSSLISDELSSKDHEVIALTNELALNYKRKLKNSDFRQWSNSYRLLQMKFKDLIGITIKEYTNKYRFQVAMKYMNEYSNVNLTNIGLACGYYDQAHFIKCFRTFAGMSPRAYMSSISERATSLDMLSNELVKGQVESTRSLSFA